nr:MAG: putative RNA-dependent RNA polymerase [Sanya botourmia-like virus 12]
MRAVTGTPEMIRPVDRKTGEEIRRSLPAKRSCDLERSARRDSSDVFIEECVNELYTLLAVFEFDNTGVSRKGTLDHWKKCAKLVGDPMKFVKWKLAAYYSASKSTAENPQAIPPMDVLDGIDTPHVLLGGRAGQWLKSVEARRPVLFESILTSVLYSKKGLPRPSEEVVAKNVLSTYVTLTTKQELPGPVQLASWADQSELPDGVEATLSVETARCQLKRTVGEIFSKKLTVEDRITPLFPSVNANNASSRREGGTLGQLLKDQQLLEGLKSEVPLVLLSEVKVKRSDVEVERTLSGPSGSEEESRETFTMRVKETQTRETTVMSADATELFRRFMVLYDRMTEAALREPRDVQLVGLPEALKVRTISKGPGYKYFVLKFLQKQWWSALQKLDCFRLTGTPVTAELVQELLGKTLKEGMKFVSADYSDATNQLAPWASDAVCDAIADIMELSDNERLLVKQSMTGHYIRHPQDGEKEYKVDGEWKIFPRSEVSARRSYFAKLESRRAVRQGADQQWGQLMGSILSFPVLCIVNATVCRWAQELDQRKRIPLRSAKMAINGDDAVFKATQQGYQLWERIASFFGLKPSVGKVYVSDQFLNINSTTYNFYRDGFMSKVKLNVKTGTEYVYTSYFEHVRYVNLGLLKGLKRSGGKDSLIPDSDGWNIADTARDLIDSAPTDPIVRERLMCQFIHNNQEVLKRYNLPWFLPQSLCGVGLPTVGQYQPRTFDLQVATKIVENPQRFRVPHVRRGVALAVWQIASKRIPKHWERLSVNTREYGMYLPSSSSQLRSLSSLSGLLCVETIFTHDFSSLFPFAGKKDAMGNDSFAIEEAEAWKRYYRSMERTWNKARTDQTIALGRPLPKEWFPQHHSMPDMPVIRMHTVSRLLPPAEDALAP